MIRRAFMVLELAHHWHMEGSPPKKELARSLLPRWHPARRHPPGWRRRWSVFLPSQPTGIHYVSSFSICPFIFHCLEMSERPCVLPLPWLHECVPTAVSGDTLCIVLGCTACQTSRMALSWGFPQFLHHYEYDLWGLWQPCQTTRR